MTDLTKITTQLALLDDETREALKAHGGPYEYWEYWPVAKFKPIQEPSWSLSGVYRVAPDTKDTINWDHVAAEFICMARDANGSAYAYAAKPKIGCTDAVVWCVGGDDYTGVHVVASYKRGTCDWKDSLVFRPGHEPKGEQNDE